jgi:hypothetical protein
MHMMTRHQGIHIFNVCMQVLIGVKKHMNIPRYLVRARGRNDVHQEGSRRPARFPVCVRAYCLPAPRER